jgi:WD40 repeat protein
MGMNKEYYAFISYSHKDEEWAKWLQHEFEHYHLPTTLNGLTGIPDKFRPIFRDIDELSGGELKPQISHALRASAYLVIICSPNSAKSPYVDGEIREFIEIGEHDGINNVCNIFPFIVEGVPHSKDELDKECFPKALRDLPSELIAGDVTRHGREHAFVKILSGTLHHSNVSFSMLWNQFERDRIEEERREREKRDRLLLLESRYLSEKALDIAQTDSYLAKMLVLKALPKDLTDPEDRPYCIEAESALRKVYSYKSAIFSLKQFQINSLSLDADCSRCVATTSDGTAKIWDLLTGCQIGRIINGYASFSHNGKIIASYYKNGDIKMWNAETGKQIGKLEGALKPIQKLSFSHDDKLLIAMSSDYSGENNTVLAWNVEDCSLISIFQVPGSNDMAIDKDGKRIGLAVYSRFSFIVYDIKEGRMIKEMCNAHSESLSSIDFSPDGKKIVTAAFDGKFKVWDWENGEVVLSVNVGKIFGAYAPVVNSSKYSINGKYIVTASRDKKIRIWNADTGELEGKPLVGHSDDVYSAVFCNDDRCIVSRSSDATVRIWDLFPHAPYRIIGRARSLPFNSVDHNTALSPDGKLVAKTSANILRIMDANTNLQIGPDFTFFEDFDRVTFSENGRGIICESERDYDVLFEWEPLQELINKTREQVKNRQFTETEKKLYYLE